MFTEVESVDGKTSGESENTGEDRGTVRVVETSDRDIGMSDVDLLSRATG